jgi:hypothetical protein
MNAKLPYQAPSLVRREALGTIVAGGGMSSPI